MRFAIPKPLVPPVEMRNIVDDEIYLRSAVGVIELVDELVGIQSSARVLDVGCAAGRLALPLLSYLDPGANGSYDGFDIRAERIEWARQHISALYPHFRFVTIDVLNRALNPEGTVDGSTLTFPYDAARFDVILFHSVFTHLLPADAWRYLAESRRCLKPSGAIYSTWYLWDTQTEQSLGSHEVLWSFPVDRGDHRLMSEAHPELAVAFDYDRLVEHIDNAGLRIAVEKRGDWRLRPTHGQDTLVLTPKPGRA